MVSLISGLLVSPFFLVLGFQPDPLFSLNAQRKERGEKRKPLRFNSLETVREMFKDYRGGEHLRDFFLTG